MLAWLAQLFAGGLLGQVNDLTKTVVGSAEQREANIHDEMQSAYGAYAAEAAAQNRFKRSWFDSFVDGINRLMRPGITGAVLWLIFALPYFDPATFAALVSSYALVPDMLWAIGLTVISFWFGGRILEKVRLGGVQGPSPEAVAKIVAAKAALAPPKAPTEAHTEAEYQAAMADTSKKAPNWAIMEWNSRRRQAQ